MGKNTRAGMIVRVNNHPFVKGVLLFLVFKEFTVNPSYTSFLVLSYKLLHIVTGDVAILHWQGARAPWINCFWLETFYLGLVLNQI